MYMGKFAKFLHFARKSEGFGGDQAEAVLLGYVVEFYCSWHIF